MKYRTELGNRRPVEAVYCALKRDCRFEGAEEWTSRWYQKRSKTCVPPGHTQSPPSSSLIAASPIGISGQRFMILSSLVETTNKIS